MKPRAFRLFARIRRWGSRLLRKRASYAPATWRGTLPPDPQTGEQCISFDLADGRVLRLQLPQDSVTAVWETLAPDYFMAIAAKRWECPSPTPRPAPAGRSTTESP